MTPPQDDDYQDQDEAEDDNEELYSLAIRYWRRWWNELLPHGEEL